MVAYLSRATARFRVRRRPIRSGPFSSPLSMEVCARGASYRGLEKKVQKGAFCPSRAGGQGVRHAPSSIESPILVGRGRSGWDASNRGGPLPSSMGRFPPRWAASLLAGPLPPRGGPLPSSLGRFPVDEGRFRPRWAASLRSWGASLVAGPLPLAMGRFPWRWSAPLGDGALPLAMGSTPWRWAAPLGDGPLSLGDGAAFLARAAAGLGGGPLAAGLVGRRRALGGGPWGWGGVSPWGWAASLRDAPPALGMGGSDSPPLREEEGPVVLGELALAEVVEAGARASPMAPTPRRPRDRWRRAPRRGSLPSISLSGRCAAR